MSDGAIIPQQDGSVVPIEGKVLNVTPETEGIDTNGLLTKLLQYANIGDALTHIERGAGINIGYFRLILLML